MEGKQFFKTDRHTEPGLVVETTEWCPGNGSRYIVALLPYRGDLGDVGSSDNSSEWRLVICALSRRSYLLSTRKDKVLVSDYVKQKFDLGDTDARYFTHMLGRLLERPTDVDEDDIKYNLQTGAWREREN